MAKVAYIFPGQGSQTVGMGQDLYDSYATARAVFEEADAALGFSLSRLCFEGPEEELKQTINAQPALVTMSIACLRVAREEAGDKLPSADFTAGHSLGEYTALVAANSCDFATAVRLARERGRLMYEAGLVKPGSMAAIIGLEEAALETVCQQTDTWIANINCPGQLVISGEVKNIEKAMEAAKDKGANRAIPLQVSGAFHTPLMQPACDGMSAIIPGVEFAEPQIAIIGNTNAQPIPDAAAIKAELLEQLCHCVQWQRSVEYMLAGGVDTFIEIGSGKVLSGLVRRINREARTMNIGDTAAIKQLAES